MDNVTNAVIMTPKAQSCGSTKHVPEHFIILDRRE